MVSFRALYKLALQRNQPGGSERHATIWKTCYHQEVRGGLRGETENQNRRQHGETALQALHMACSSIPSLPSEKNVFIYLTISQGSSVLSLL